MWAIRDACIGVHRRTGQRCLHAVCPQALKWSGLVCLWSLCVLCRLGTDDSTKPYRIWHSGREGSEVWLKTSTGLQHGMVVQQQRKQQATIAVAADNDSWKVLLKLGVRKQFGSGS
jgi:hypothetical protein